MLMQVKSGFMMGGATGPGAPTFVGSSTSADDPNISMPGGIASGDLGIFIDIGNQFGSPPTDTLPSGWTRIGSTLTDTGGGYGVGQRLNMAYKVLDGTETTLTGITGDAFGSGKHVLVFRKSALLTWGAPGDVEAQVDNDGCTDKTINVGTAPLIVIGFVNLGGSSALAMSPAATQVFSLAHGNGRLNVGYIIYGAGAVDNTISPASTDYAIGGFYVPLT